MTQATPRILLRLLTCLLLALQWTAAEAQPLPGEAEGENPVAKLARTYLGRGYAAHTLDRDRVERLVMRRDSVDCTTLVEMVLAEALCPSRPDSALLLLRYRDGRLDGYASRLHYVADWAENAVRHGLLIDVTALHCPSTTKLNLFFMTRHHTRYPALQRSPGARRLMAERERALTGQTVHVLGRNSLMRGVPSWIRPGDVIALTTARPGLDVSHMGIAVMHRGRIHLLHASLTAGKVIVDPLPLDKMVADGRRRWTGIRVFRARLPWSEADAQRNEARTKHGTEP